MTLQFLAPHHVIKEFSSFSKSVSMIAGESCAQKFDEHIGKFSCRIESFTRWKDLLKNRKITVTDSRNT